MPQRQFPMAPIDIAAHYCGKQNADMPPTRHQPCNPEKLGKNPMAVHKNHRSKS